MFKIKKILFITLSNIGDVILSLPALDLLRLNFPQAKITILCGERPKELFQDNPFVEKVIILDKQARLREKIQLCWRLKKENFDLIVDLRNTFFGAFLPAKYRTPVLRIIPKDIIHMKDRHFYLVEKLIAKINGRVARDPKKNFLNIRPQDQAYIEGLLVKNNITPEDKIIVISSGARSHTKRWPQDNFVGLINALMLKYQAKIILVGDKDDAIITGYVSEKINAKIIDLTTKTNLLQLACLLKKSLLLITNDSAVLHLASYLDVATVVIFGPTSELRYGPWGQNYAIAKKEIFCRPCEKALCRFDTLDCLKLIGVEDVLEKVTNILTKDHRLKTIDQKYKRILIVRTDRIGDVLLSTPAIKALRIAYPNAYIAVMVSPYAKEIVEGNPYLDEVIVYDKDKRHKSWVSSIKFSLELKKKKFDLAVILHPINRAHLITFFAGIPKRVGFNKKMEFLLTDKIEHTKQLGQKHELEYTLDLVRYLGIEPKDASLFMPIKFESERWAEDLFAKENISVNDKVVAIHPSASCPSRIWPTERFAYVADKLIENSGFKVIIIAGPQDITLANNMAQQMKHPVINLAGKTSLSQLASVLKRCRLHISSDTGPMHIACAVGTPVIVLFGRNQKGLSPLRWAPTMGGKNIILHKKETGCNECLAHNCKKGFVCFKAITVEEVLNAADKF